MRKWAKTDLSDLENYLLNYSIKNEKKYQNFTFSDLSDLNKLPLERFNQIYLLAVHHHLPRKVSCQNRENVI